MSAPSRSPWLSIIGIGEDGLAGLGDGARKALSGASLVVGGKRHLALAEAAIAGERLAWPSPMTAAIDGVLARRGQPTAVLASGDPFCFGVGSLLAERLQPGEWQAFPALSSFSLAAARLGWALQDVDCLSLCGRPLETLAPYLQPKRRCLVLSADVGTPAVVAGYLVERGFGLSRVAVLEALGGPNERSRWTTAAGFDLGDVQSLNVVALELEGGTKVIPKTSGLDDACFENDGQLTKREIRAVTLSSLAPRAGEMLWDIGCGAGSIAIEWLLAHPANRAVGIERDAERAARARRNALALGVPRLEVIEAEAHRVLRGREKQHGPDAIFIGGGVHEPGMIESVWAMLPLGGRVVANAVTLESERALLDARARFGGTLLRLDIARSDAIGQLSAFRPAMTVTQWSATKRGVVAGFGWRSGATAEQLYGALKSALQAAGCAIEDLTLLAAPEFKEGASLESIAARLGLDLMLVRHGDLEAAQERCRTRSAVAERTTGLGSIAEAAALATAGPGAVLLGARIQHEAVATCAIARRVSP